MTTFKTFDIDELTDDATEIMLYDPETDDAILLDGLPDSVRLRSDGGFRGYDFFSLLGLLTVLGPGLFLLYLNILVFLGAALGI